MTKVLVLNGPNLNRLGSREPDVYGTASYSDLVAQLETLATSLKVEVEVRQTNDESELVSWLHEAVDSKSHVILNPAAFTHYSYSLRDACAMVTTSGLSLIEVHLSNPHAREEFRHNSVISGVATGVIAGFGLNSYLLALRQLSH
jgi:3-dehydroquinate dehydratase-2